MKKTGKSHQYISALLLPLAIIASQVAMATEKARVTVSANPNPVDAEESMLLRVEVSDAQGRVGKPSFDSPNFDIVGQSSSIASSSQFVNGQFVMSGKYQFSFVLYPKQAGTHTISKIQVPVGNDTLRADDVIVQVRGEPKGKTDSSVTDDQSDDTNNTSNAKEPARLNSDFTVHLSLNKKSAYVGEPLIAEYWVYDFGNLVSQEIKKWPSFNGFWKEDLEVANRIQYEQAYVGMKPMRRALLGRFALYGLKPGRISIDKLLVTGTHLIRDRAQNENDPFFGFSVFGFARQRTATNASQETVVDILPLPEHGRPSNFGGTVGNFTISLSADKNTLEAHTPLNIQVTYDGTGNFSSINEPKLRLAPELEVFESNVSFKDSVPIGSRRPLANKKTFNFVLIPRKEGSYTIPALSFSFFDPKKKIYETVDSQSITVQVTPSTHAAAQANPSPQIPTSAKSTQNPDVPSLISSYALPALLALAAALALVLTVFGGLRLWKKQKAKLAKKEKTSISWSMFHKAKNANEPNEICAAAREFLRNSVHAKIGLNPQGMLRDDLTHYWSEHHYPAELLESYHKLMVEIDSIQFGARSLSVETKRALLERIEMLGTELGKLKK